jgi:hypothetical protein
MQASVSSVHLTSLLAASSGCDTSDDLLLGGPVSRTSVYDDEI